MSTTSLVLTRDRPFVMPWTSRLYLMRRGISPEQIQDFMPLPLTASGSMFYTGKDPFTGREVSVPSSFRERRMHRALMQWRNPKNHHLIREALKILEREDLWPEYQNAWSRYDR